tara:strand:- start:1202 stop:1477 length:276 start_codon:yes stop_codon:yes gene_type:complete
MIVEDLMSSVPLLSDSYINEDNTEDEDYLHEAQDSFPFEIDSEFGSNPYRLAEEKYRYNHELVKESFEKLCIIISLCFPTYILFFFIYKSI